MIAGDVLRDAIAAVATRPFRMEPYFNRSLGRSVDEAAFRSSETKHLIMLVFRWDC
jgi:hypothetical protein